MSMGRANIGRKLFSCQKKLDTKCSIKVNSYIRETSQYRIAFQLEVLNGIKPRPKNPNECDDSFIKNYKNSWEQQCKTTSRFYLGIECTMITIIFTLPEIN
ncbi:uncharacterized protein LOC111623292 [Centruroides sculpturatus]|uniref:uncharacterized protein LOC111623292 n=1 Tax=Centruroides sculpturatus TaxID=218467 RepID=UPI000C6DAB4D|nr:uncharacterized protein LOC111623292 [Centruroides sculpturatus]